MPSILSNKFRNFVAEGFFRLANTPKRLNKWVTGLSISVGDLCYYLDKKYIAANSGITGTNPPLHINGKASDGGVDWVFLESMVKQEFNSGGLYFFIGKNSEWDDEENPPAPQLTDKEFGDARSEIIALRKYSTSNIGIKNSSWVSGTVYTQYNSKENMFNDLENNFFYCIADNARIYVCLNNNNGSVSVNKPIGTGTSPVLSADGYQWKYVGEVSGEAAFGNITIGYKKYDDGSPQWDIQENAKYKSISTFSIKGQTGTFTTPKVSIISDSGAGASATATKTVSNTIRQILISAEGSNYEEDDTFAIVKENSASGDGADVDAVIVEGEITGFTINSSGSSYSNVVVIIVGDGTGASANATVFNNALESVSVIQNGTGYTWAKVFIIPGNSGAVGTPVMAPTAGHGANILTELGCYNFWNYIEIPHNDYFRDDVEFRQLGIITNIEDDSGEIATEIDYIGPGHPDFNDSGVILNRINKSSGEIIYLSNVIAVDRTSEQDERIRINLTF